VLAVALTLSALRHAYVDITHGAIFFSDAWMFVTLFVGTICCVSGCVQQEGQRRKQERERLRQTQEQDCCTQCLGDCCDECEMAIYASLAFICAIVWSLLGFLFMQCVLSVLFREHMKDYNCSSLRWSQGASQLPNLFQTFLMFPVLHHATAGRLLGFAPFMVASLIYMPPVFLVLVTHVLPGLVVFAFPMSLLLALCLRLLHMVHKRVTGNVELCTWDEVYDDAKKVVTVPVWPKLMLVPIVEYVRFVGEAMVRKYRGQPWWQCLYRTWAERTLANYLAQMSHTAWGVLDAVLKFL